MPQVRLEVAGKVNAYLTVAPRYVRFIGKIDQPLQQSIKITPLAGYPVTIKEVRIQQPDNLRYELKPLGDPPNQSGYELIVENARQEAGNYQDMITILTDSKQTPSITIPVYARLHGPGDRNNQKPN